MTCASYSHGRKTIVRFGLSVALLLSAGIIQAQTDPGPRPVGTQGFFAPPAIGPFCPGLPSAKFPGAFTAATPCIDVDQPPSGGADGAGNVLANGGNLTGLWFEALTVFETTADVGPGPQTGGSTIPGLGPSFNAISCFQCHSQPAVGGSSPGKTKGIQTPGFPNGNPQVGDAPDSTQLSNVSSFISASGPVREARFPKGFAGDSSTFTDPVKAGAVAELFVVTPAIGAPSNCQIGQEPFTTEVSNSNIIFRIPIPTFGDGFVENTPDDNLEANLTQDQAIANNPNIFNPVLGITGTFNRSGNDQTITRFGWKAQNKSLLMFAGEASNVEMGVTNELFPNERTDGNGQCSPNNEPEDQVIVPPDPTDPNSRGISKLLADFGPSGVASDISNDIENFAVFMRLNGAPSQCNWDSPLVTNSNGTTTATCKALDSTSVTGSQIFGSVDPSVSTSFTSPSFSPPVAGSTTVSSIGCVLCHSDLLRTTTSQAGSLNNAQFHPFSDFAIHTMDSSLADGVTQGNANGSQFRTAPLWGLGQRLFFMHDGRCSDLLCTINAHAPNAGTSSSNCTAAMGEACQVIVLFNNLNSTQKEDVLHFLRSL